MASGLWLLFGKTIITADLVQGKKEEAQPQTPIMTLERLTPMQKEVVEKLNRPMTPGDIANALDLAKYKSRQHAVRSVNNTLKDLLARGFVERAKKDKTYIYSLAPRLRTIFVKA